MPDPSVNFTKSAMTRVREAIPALMYSADDVITLAKMRPEIEQLPEIAAALYDAATCLRELDKALAIIHVGIQRIHTTAPEDFEG